MSAELNSLILALLATVASCIWVTLSLNGKLASLLDSGLANVANVSIPLSASFHAHMVIAYSNEAMVFG